MPKSINTAINWNNAITRSLVWSALPGPNTNIDYITGMKGVLLASGKWGGINLLGSSLQSTSTTNGGAYWNWSPQIQKITNSFSIVVFVQITTITDNAHFFCLPYNTTWTSPFDAISFQSSSPDTSKLQLQYSIAGSLVGSTTTTTGLIASGQGLTMLGAVYTGSKVRFYKNGVFIEEVTPGTTGNVDFGNKISIELMNRHHNDNGEGFSGTCNFASLWSRALNDNEIKSIFSNPFQLYKSPMQSSMNTGIFR
jgi:hypothetical protein